MTEQKIPTTDKEAKAHFKSIALGGYTLKDWREFIGTLSGVNTKKMKPLELYHLKERLNNALRKKPVAEPTTEQRILDLLTKMTAKVDTCIEELKHCSKTTPHIEIPGKSTMSVAGEDGIFKPVELKHTGFVGWFKRVFSKPGNIATVIWLTVIVTVFVVFFTPIANINEWIPNLLARIGGCA